MSSDETNYYRSRANAERALAQTFADKSVAAIHEKMAELYDRLIAIDGLSRESSSVVQFDQAMRA